MSSLYLQAKVESTNILMVLFFAYPLLTYGYAITAASKHLLDQ